MTKMARLALVIVLGAAFYLFMLCALYTAGFPISNAIVAGVDGAIVLAALALAAWVRPDALALPLLLIAANFLLIALLAQHLEQKAVRDVLLITAFFALGHAVSDFVTAKMAFLMISSAVVAVGLFEYLAPRLFVEHVNVLQFYVMRGEVTQERAQYVDNSLFVSGMRNSGRALAPFLGPHRVSSIFLEPVSMGNFGAIATAFAIALRRVHPGTAIAAALAGAFAIVAADARFAALATALFGLALLVPIAWRPFVLAVLPVAAIALLVAMANLVAPTGDDLPSRLSISGAALMNMDAAALFGLAPGGPETLDSGYAYTISAVGLPFCAVLWLAFLGANATGPQSSCFKYLIGVYICALLCVSGSSLFALKTGALLWFLLGALIAAEAKPAAAWLPPRAPAAPAPLGERA